MNKITNVHRYQRVYNLMSSLNLYERFLLAAMCTRYHRSKNRPLFNKWHVSYENELVLFLQKEPVMVLGKEWDFEKIFNKYLDEKDRQLGQDKYWLRFFEKLSNKKVFIPSGPKKEFFIIHPLVVDYCVGEAHYSWGIKN